MSQLQRLLAFAAVLFSALIGRAATTDLAGNAIQTAGLTPSGSWETYIISLPTVTALSLTELNTAGGSTVTLTGTGFTGATAVKFGSTAATSFTVNSATSITAVAPAGTVGATDNVTVTTQAGTSAAGAGNAFSYGGSAVFVTNTSTTSGINGSALGQSFTMPGTIGDVSANRILTGFNFLTTTSAPSGAGTAYLLDGAYDGTAAGLASLTGSSTPKKIAAGAWNGSNRYVFPNVTLAAGVKYYVYTDSVVPAAYNVVGDPLAGGEFYYTVGGGGSFVVLSAGDGAFQVWTAAAAPTVTTASATNLAATSVTLGGNVTADGGDAVTERGIAYSMSSATPTTSDTKVAIGSGTGTFSQSVTGLTASTTYFVRAFATNSVGTSYGSAIAITTPPPAPVISSAATTSGTYGSPITTYTITASNSPTSYNATGLPSGLSINSTNGQITGTPTDATGSPYSVTISATNAGGTGTATLTITIAKRNLFVTSGITANGKVYDGTTTATLTVGTITFIGKVGTDDVSVNASNATGFFADRNVGTNKTVTVSGLTLTGAASANYNVSAATLSLKANITEKALTVTGVTASNKAYDRTTAATVNLSNISVAGVILGDNISVYTGSAIATFTDKNVGTEKTVTVNGLLPSGNGAANYTVTSPTTTADITAKPLTVMGAIAYNKTYDRTVDVSFNVGSTTLSGVVSGDTVTLNSSVVTGSFVTKTAGTSKTVQFSGFSLAAGGDSANYTLVQPTVTADIAPKALTVTGVVANDKTYDGTTAATVDLGGATLVGVVPLDVVTLDSSSRSGLFASKTVGSNQAVTISGLALTGADAANYTLTPPSATASITAKQLTITGVTANNKVYDGNTGHGGFSVGSAALVGVVNGDNVTLASGAVTAAFTTKTVGTAKTVEFSGFALASGGDSANYTLTQPTATADITARPLTVGGFVGANNKIYDRTTTATLDLSGASLNNVISGDSVALDASAVSARFADKLVGNGKAVTISGLTLSGGDAGNYALTQPTATANITAKALTVSGVTAGNKTYDATTTATLDTSSAALVGVVNGDTVSLVTSNAAGAFASKGIGAAKFVTISGLALGGADGSNYSLTPPTATADITAKALTIAGITANNKVYDAGTTAALNVGGAALVGVISGDNVTLDASGATGMFALKAVANGKTVTIAGLSLAGSDSGNYTFTPPTTTANITSATLTVTGVTASNKIYDGNTTATLNTSSAALSGVIGSDAVTLTTSGASANFASKAVGTAKAVTIAGFTLAGADAANYSLTPPTTTADITVKTLTVSGITAINKTYDATTTATLNIASAALVGVISGDTVALDASAATGAFASKTVANGKAVTISGLTLSGTDAGNYSLTSPTTTADISARTLTISGITAANKTYDGAVAAALNTASAALVGVIGNDVVTLTTSGANATFATKTVGAAKAVTITGFALGGADAANYSLTQPTTTADISAKALTVTGLTAANKIYDATVTATLNTGSATLVGIVNGDTVSLVATNGAGAFASKTVGAAKQVTITGLTLGGADAGNYSLTPPTATADITAKTLTVSGITAANKAYDATTTATLNTTAAVLVGVVSGDSVMLDASAATGTFASKSVGTAKTVAIAALALTGADAANYTLTAPTTTASITTASLTVTAVTVSNKTYDGTTAATVNANNAALNGLMGGDAVTLTTASATATFATKTVGAAKPVTITGLALTGADAGNYALTQPTATADITAKTLTVSGLTAANKTYDATTTATLNTGSAALVGIVDGDSVSLGTTGATGTFATKTVGGAKTVTISGLTLGGADAANYSLTQPTVTAGITAKALTVSGISANNKVYDGTTTATIVTTNAALVGVLGSDGVTLDAANVGGAFADQNVGTAKPVSISGLALAGAEAANYTLTPPSTTADITAATASITLGSLAQTYDRTPRGATATTTPANLATTFAYDGVPLAVAASNISSFAGAIGRTIAVTVTGTTSGNVYGTGPYAITSDLATAAVHAGAVSSGETKVVLVTIGAGQGSYTGSTANGVTTQPGGAANASFTFAGNATGNYLTTAPINAGSHSVTVTIVDQNYTGTTDGTLVVAPVTLTVSGLTAAAKVYDGGTTAVLDATAAALVGVLNGDVVNLGTGSAAGAFADKSVGLGKVVTVSGLTISGAGAANYTLTQPTTTASIAAKNLTVSGVTANAKTYDATIVASLNVGSAALVGVVSGDNVSLNTTAAAGLFATKSVGAGKTVTVSGLALAGADAGNYLLTQPTTAADIAAKVLTVTGIAANAKTYDASLVAALNLSGAALVGVMSGDDVSLNTGAAAGAFASKNVGANKPVAISGLMLAGADAANYSLVAPATSADITAKAVSVSGITAASKVYDGTLTAAASFAGANLVGIVAGDTVTLVTTNATAAFASKTVGTGKTVTLAGLTLAGADAANYALTQPGTTADITAKTLSVSGLAATDRVYDATTVAPLSLGSATLVGVVGADDVSLVTSGAVGAFATKTVGAAKAVTITGLALAGADAVNYSLTQPSATATISTKSLTLTGATAANKSYDGSTAASVNFSRAALVGVISGDAVTLVSGGASGQFASAGPGSGKTVSIAGLSLDGADAPNYTLVAPTLTADIAKGVASIAFANLSQTYTGSPRSVGASTTPSGLSVTLTYNGSPNAPTDAGTYAIGGTIADANYDGSGSATLTIAKATQTVTFATASSVRIGEPVALSASASSGLTVTFSLVSGNATLTGSTLTLNDAGPIVVRATQAGNANYNAASADQMFAAANKLSQTITFAALANKRATDAPFTLTASASSGLPVSFTLVNGPATLSGATLTMTGLSGAVTVRASQAGNATYGAAPDVTQTFNVLGSETHQVFFGLTQNNDTVAIDIAPDGKSGTLLCYLGATGEALFVTFTLNADGTFDATVTPASAGPQASPLASEGHRVARAAVTRTFRGRLSGGVLTGAILELGLNFSAGIEPPSGPTAGIAGFYQAASTNTASGSAYSIVGTQGQVYVLAITPSVTSAGTGAIKADNSFAIQGAQNATITGTIDQVTTTVSGTIAVDGKTTDRFAGAVARTDRLINLAARARLAPNTSSPLITGFVIGGTGPKRVVVRAVGPALSAFGVQGALADPKLRLFDAAGTLVAENDNWSGSDTAATFTQVGAFALSEGSRDAALVTTLEPGAYTVHVMDGGGTGVVLAEVYDASANPGGEAQQLVNLSTRGFVTAGEGALIGGFVINGNAPKRVLVRGSGPGLAAFNVAGPLADPVLKIRDANGALVAQNDNWSTPVAVMATQVAATPDEIAAAGAMTGAFALTAGSRDAAVVITLAPGAYTAEVSGAAGATGAALVEIFELP